jgi:hypothetical protein
MSYLSSIKQITKDYLSQLLEREVVNFEITPVSEGHTQCLKVKVSVSHSENENIKLFLKSFTTTDEFKREFTFSREFGQDLEKDLNVMHNWAHNYEINFYKLTMSPSFPQNLFDVIPRCYVLKENVIGIENLCETRNARILSMWDPGLNVEEITKLLIAYAKFHGLSMSMGLANELASFDEIAVNRDVRILYSSKSRGFDLNGRLLDIIEKMSLSDLAKENLKKIRNLGFTGLTKMFSRYKSFVQGDANPNNILVDENWENIILVDFQEGCIGNPLADIGWFMITSGEIGDEKEVLEIYFKLLSEYAGKDLNNDVLMKDYYIGIILAAYLILMVVGVVSTEYKDTFFYRLVDSCVLKLNKYDSEISKLLNN